jgi:arylsulfatase A-like enzyme
LFLFTVSAFAADRPNILFIFSDDHATQALSAYDHKLKLLETPHLDRIAKEGMLFNRCLVTNSICGPSRAVIQTGKYSHLNGFYMNGNRFDGDQQTFPKLLQKAGYQTAVVGKWHLESDPQGFDYWHILPGQGAYYNPPMIKNGEQVKHEGYTSDIIGDLTLEWLENRDKSKPFMLMSQHKAPHRAWEPAPRHLGFDDDREYPLPETLFDDYSGRGIAEERQDMTIEITMNDRDVKFTEPRNYTPEQLAAWKAYYEPRNKAFHEEGPSGKDLIEWKYQRYMHDYLACVKAVDENVGRVLDYLDENDLAENTLVIYSSDQGFYLGEHGWFDKRWIYEESLTTPLLARWPGEIEPGSTCGELVSNLDFAETFLDAAGVAIPGDMQGRSLVPLMKGVEVNDWRSSFYYHYYEFPGAHSVRRHYGVVTDRYKLFHFYEPDVNYWSLIDRKKDPNEMTSVYGDPEYAEAQKELHTELDRLRTELKVPPASEDPVRKPRQPRNKKGAAKAKKAK